MPQHQCTIEDLAVYTSNLGANGPWELNIDRSPSKVGTHGEVCDRSDECDGCGDVVEDALLAGLHMCETQEDQGGKHHDCGDRPVHVGAMSGDGDANGLTIDGIA